MLINNKQWSHFMASSFFSKVDFSSEQDSIMTNVEGFSIQTAAIMSNLQGRQVTTNRAEDDHKNILAIFNKTKQELKNVYQKINDNRTYENQNEMDTLFMLFSGFEDRISQEFNVFNDTILTFCPTAKIDYGALCIKPANGPKTQREIRGDGNCFVSAFITRLLETAVERKEINKLVQFIAEDGIHAPELKKEIFSILQQSPSDLEATLQNNHKILPLINYFRQIAANEMKKNKGQYEVFFLNDLEDVYKAKIAGKSYDALVNEYVLKMGVDFSQPMMTALCKKLNFNVRIIDPKIGAPQGVNILREGEIKATFCRSGAHYSVLYPNEAPASSAVQVQPVQLAPKTKITVKFDAGWGNKLFVRGNGPGMGDWGKEKAKELRNEGGDIWTFEIEGNKEFDYKLLINNDENRWEKLDGNHTAKCGTKEQIVPKFN